MQCSRLCNDTFILAYCIRENEDTITKEIEKAIERANIKCNYKLNLEKYLLKAQGFLPYTITGEEPMTKTFMSAIEKVCNTKPSISYFQSIEILTT